MAKNFLEGVNLKAQGSRHGFDVSYQNQFTAPLGMLLPCFFQRVNPDDKVKLANETQTICDGLVKPAFMRLREHIDYYFIPATQLWMAFDNFVTGQDSFFSSSVSYNNNDEVPSFAPVFTLGCLNDALIDWRDRDVKDDLGYSFIHGASRLLDLLGYCNLSGVSLQNFEDLNLLGWANDGLRMNLFPLLCYQKVYYDFFRNPKYENNDVYAYNLDTLQNNYVIDEYGVKISQSNFQKWFKIHYRWQKKDYFTQTQPNILPDASQIGYNGLSATVVGSNFPGIIGSRPNVQSSSINENYTATSGLTRASSNPTAERIANQGVSVANIRFAFAFDKLMRRMREAGPDFDKQMLSQFGISPYDARHGKAYYIGGYTNRLSSSDVTNMTGDGIGELAGQINAYSDNSSKILNYHVKEHGYIIGIYSTSVDNMYQSYRTSRECLLKDRFDWFNPAFENLGLQPVFASERDYTGLGTNLNDKATAYENNSYQEIIGYVPRYSELKTHVDECHGLLSLYSNVVGLKEWNVQVNTQFMNEQALNKRVMLINPAQFDNVSGVNYNGVQNTDHFVVNMYHHSHKVSNMSLYEEF